MRSKLETLLEWSPEFRRYFEDEQTTANYFVAAHGMGKDQLEALHLVMAYAWTDGRMERGDELPENLKT